MNVLLVAVNAKYIHSNLGVHSLKAYARQFGDSIEVAEFTINHQVSEILAEIYEKKPDLVAFSCYIWNLEYIEHLLEDLPKILPDTLYWVGGPEVSYDAGTFLEKHPMVTGVMEGEGEEIFRQLMEQYFGKQPDLGQVSGITWRDNTGVIRHREHGSAISMDSIPFLYQDLEAFENRILYYETSRGCPFSCSYCLSSIEKSVRFRSFTLVEKELQFFLDHKVPQVKFVDRTFNCSHKHAMEIWTYIKEHDNGITNFHFEIAADILREEEIILLNAMRPGLVQLEIGVQSTNRQTIEEINRTMDLAVLEKIVSRLKTPGNIHLHLDLIAGLPYEDLQSFQKSFNEVYAMKPNELQLGFLKVLKGSHMKEKEKTYGLRYSSRPVYEVFSTDWISYEEIKALKRVEEMLEVYYNSGQFSGTMEVLEHFFVSPFALYEQLGQFYVRKGYWNRSHSRQARFTILREFICEQIPDHLDEMEEWMLFDLYSRENLKNRPEWAWDFSERREEIRAFYRKEAQELAVLPEDYKGYQARQLQSMTHLELFRVISKQACLFEYRHRNPVTGNAAVSWLIGKEMET